MIKKIDLGAAMGGFAQAADAKYVHGELVNGSQVKIEKSNLANIIGDVLGIRKIKAIYNQVDCKLTLSNNCVAIVCMLHRTAINRTPEIAFVSNSYGGYAVNTICKTNTGKGIYVSPDGLYVVINGISSNKAVTAMVVSGTGEIELNAMT